MRYMNKRAEGYIWPCVLIIIVCMLVSAFVTFAVSYGIVKQTKQNTRIVLDNYVMTDAIDIYNSIKQGNDETEELDSAEFISKLSSFCTFVKNENMYYNYDDEGNVQYFITQPTLHFSTDSHLKIYTEYTIYIPVYFANAMVDTIRVPIKIESKLSEKFE